MAAFPPGTDEELARWRQYVDSCDRELSRIRRERAHLLAWLAALHPATAVLTVDPGSEGVRRLRLVVGGWPMSWPLRSADLPLFGHVRHAGPGTPPATPDGDDGADQEEWLRRHTQLLALEGAVHSALTGHDTTGH
ncbi:hypothetical protein [Streptomyces sp. B93]|uniref:hypothetical protein n=1 Tax=Streptomyces sp. B93 TaxID=2824875 RepID=UPI001B380D8F|nr:hypothetical protein [Streptomyces sp. B93]MBQ1094189.1 hypothetical protein [Streptomyces sp. B93]